MPLLCVRVGKWGNSCMGHFIAYLGFCSTKALTTWRQGRGWGWRPEGRQGLAHKDFCNLTPVLEVTTFLAVVFLNSRTGVNVWTAYSSTSPYVHYNSGRLGSPLTMDQFGWTESEAVMYLGISMACGGLLSLGTFVSIGRLAQRWKVTSSRTKMVLHMRNIL